MSDSSIEQNLRKCSSMIEMILKKSHIFTVESLPKNKKMILKDKKLIYDPFIQHILLLRILVQELTSKEKDFKPFWSQQSMDLSKKLWLPTKIDLQDSVSNSLNISSNKLVEEYKSLTEKNTNLQNKNCPKISLVSSTFSIVDKWESGDTVVRNKKIKLYLKKDQKQILNKWFGTCRYVYNRALEYTKHPYNCDPNYMFSPYHHLNFISMRNMFVTKLGNGDYLNEWEFETPKDVRAGSIKELITNLTTNISKIKKNKTNLKKFKMCFKSKKKKSDSILIPKSAIQYNTNSNNFEIYKKFIGKKENYSFTIGKREQKKLGKEFSIDHDSRIIKDNSGDFYLLIPQKKTVKMHEIDKKIVALDPGQRTFMTGYSPELIFESNIIKPKIEKYKKKISTLQSISKTKNIQKMYDKIKNLVNDLHWKTITFLRKNFTDVLIPIFETQKMTMKTSLNKKTKDDLLKLSHYRFRQRLIEKTKEYKNFRVYTINESFTTKTCTNCGYIKNNVGSAKIFNCDKCFIKIDRDINGARNIFLKYVHIL